MDLAIENATLLTMAGEGLGIIDDGTIAFEGTDIASLGPAHEFDSDPDRRIDGTDLVVMPGLVDAHRHTTHTLLRGAAQDLPEIEWMTDGLGPIARHAEESDRITGARLGAIEGLQSGVTTVCEYTDEVSTLVESVYRPLGTRVVATETINAVVDDREERGPGEPYAFDREKGEKTLDRAEALFDRHDDDQLVTPAYGPQALDMVPRDLLKAVTKRAHEHERDVHVHVAQGRRERLQIEARYGEEASTVGVLDDIGLLSDRLVAVHCHDATTDERARIADAGARFVGCPSSIGAIDGVVPPVVEFLDRGAPTALGTDQAPGPGGHDALRELRTAAMLAKTDAGDPTAFPAWKALEVGTIGGARVLGLDDRIGSLEAGKAADVITIDRTHTSIAPSVESPFHTLVPNLVYSATRGAVRDVFVAGKQVVEDGDVRGLDEENVVETARKQAQGVFREAAEDWRAAGSELVDKAADGWL
ncbi:MAG: 5-methylthioadenosine/S-adenosylhomocysteine deaminase [Natrialbaceae archaeon]|jgi:5-methylthioadenosine/S-adenosylhomocysteine deaminase